MMLPTTTRIIGRTRCFRLNILYSQQRYSFSQTAAANNNKKNKPFITVLEFRASDKTVEQHEHQMASERKRRVKIYSQKEGGNVSDWNVTTETRVGLRGKASSPTNATNPKEIQEAFYNHVVTHFLPAHYPHSVAPGYARFCLLAFGASVAGSAAMVLSTQTLLLAVGVVGSNSGTASVMAGALNWVLKDGIGQLGGVIFASKMGESKMFDSDPKRWRMLSALSLDFASLLEVTAPFYYSSWVLPIACVANIGKNIGYLTAGASRAAIHLSLAQRGNLADVTAKSGSQSMAAGLLGTGAGIGLSSLLNHDPTNFIMGFCVLSMFHEGCNYASLQNVPLLHFNRHRLNLVVSHFIETQSVLTPVQVAEREHYFPLSLHKDGAESWLTIGSPLSVLCPGPVDEFQQLTTLFAEEAYLLNVVQNQIHLSFLDHASGEDLIKGMYNAYLLQGEMVQSSSLPNEHHYYDLLSKSYEMTKEHSPSLSEQLQSQGWRTDTDVTNIEPTKAFRLSIQYST